MLVPWQVVFGGLMFNGGVAPGVSVSQSSSERVPEGSSLGESDFAKLRSGVDDGYAKNYKKYLVGVDSGRNDAGWEWAFKNKYSSSARSSGFAQQKIDNNGQKGGGLREVCSKAYSSPEDIDSNTRTITSDGDVVKYLEDEVWKFCSMGEGKPKTLEESTVKGEKDKLTTGIGKDKIGGQNKKDLLSIDDPYNKGIWELRQKEWAEAEDTDDGDNKFFANTSSSSGDNIKDKCELAYERGSDEAETDTNAPDKDETIKGCSLSGKSLVKSN